MKVIGQITMIIILAVLGAMSSGYAVSVMWGWFVVPTFGLPELSIPIAIGLAYILRLIVVPIPEVDGNKDFNSLIGKAIASTFLVPAMFLLCGWIVTNFI